MKRYLIAIAFLVHVVACIAQPIVQVDVGYWHFPVIDNIFKTYQLAHPWSTQEIKPIGIGSSISAGWNQRLLASRGLQAIGLVQYSYQATEWKNSGQALVAGFHTGGFNFSLRSHPRCLYKEVQNTGPLGTRWFIELGSGYSWNFPFARKWDERVSISNQQPYRSISGQFNARLSSGWHALTVGPAIITLEGGLTWFPRFELEGFATAVLGHNEPVLSEVAVNCLLAQATLRVTLGKKTKNWWDAPRSGDKS